MGKGGHTIMVFIQDYEAASENFLKCLAIEKNQPTAMLYHGLSLYHRGRVKVNKVMYYLVRVDKRLICYAL